MRLETYFEKLAAQEPANRGLFLTVAAAVRAAAKGGAVSEGDILRLACDAQRGIRVSQIVMAMQRAVEDAVVESVLLLRTDRNDLIPLEGTPKERATDAWFEENIAGKGVPEAGFRESAKEVALGHRR